MALLTTTEVSALLGRPLTATETTNFSTYIDIAQESVEGLLCMSLDVQATPATATTKTFTRRQEFSTVFTDIFTEVTAVTIEGTATTDYHASFWDNVNKGFYNSIVFENSLGSSDLEIAITAKWGFTTLPSDLKRLVAQAFAVTSSAYRVKQTSSKKIEDFSISYGDLSDDEQFINQGSRTIRKYSLCGIMDIQSGYRC